MTMKTYAEKLRDPRWQRKRLEIMQRDNFACTQCGDTKSTLNVHHWKYAKEPWDVSNHDLATVCHTCHQAIEEAKILASHLIRIPEMRTHLLKMMHIPIIHTNEIGQGYRKLDDDEVIKEGDEFFCMQGTGWTKFGRAIGNKYCNSQKTPTARRKIRTGYNIYEVIAARRHTVSLLDTLIDGAPEYPTNQTLNQ